MSDSNKDHTAAQGSPARTKELRINGPMTANIVGLIASVSRIENRVINMSMAQAPHVRDKASSISERFQRALRMFEDELRSLNKDAEADDRPSRRRDQPPKAVAGKGTDQVKGQSQQPAGSAAAAGKPKNKSRNRNKGKGQDVQRPGEQTAVQATVQVGEASQPAAPVASGTEASSKPAANKPAAKSRSAGRSEDPTTPVKADASKSESTTALAPAL